MKAVEDVIAKEGKIDILITNNGGPPKKSLADLTLEDWQEAFNAVFICAMEATRTALPIMQKQHWGRIVMLNSTASIEPVPGLTLSNAIRPALNGFANDISRYVAADNVTINVIQTGYTETERLKSAGFDEKALIAHHPAKRLGKPEELAKLTAFLASEHASYITGQWIAFDGGAMHSI